MIVLRRPPIPRHIPHRLCITRPTELSLITPARRPTRRRPRPRDRYSRVRPPALQRAIQLPRRLLRHTLRPAPRARRRGRQRRVLRDHELRSVVRRVQRRVLRQAVVRVRRGPAFGRLWQRRHLPRGLDLPLWVRGPPVPLALPGDPRLFVGWIRAHVDRTTRGRRMPARRTAIAAAVVRLGRVRPGGHVAGAGTIRGRVQAHAR